MIVFKRLRAVSSYVLAPAVLTSRNKRKERGWKGWKGRLLTEKGASETREPQREKEAAKTLRANAPVASRITSCPKLSHVDLAGARSACGIAREHEIRQSCDANPRNIGVDVDSLARYRSTLL
mgnify:CR=1 FL=1